VTALLRVLHVVRPAQGGIRQHVLNLFGHTDRTRFALSLAGPAEFLATLPTCDLQSAVPLAISASFSLRHDLVAALRLSRLAYQVDLIHAHGLRAGWVTALASLFRPVPFLATAHNLIEPNGKAARIGLRLIGHRARRVIAVSQAVATGLSAAGITPNKIVVIPNGIDLALFKQIPSQESARLELSVAPDAFVVGTIARLSHEKGVDVLFRAAALTPRITYLVAGDGPLRESLAAAAPPNTRLLGRIDDTRILLAAADALAIPSRQEGQGIVALEAMVAGVPVVASRVGGLAEMLTEGRTALLVPSDDPTALAEALRRIQNDSALRHLLTVNAASLVHHKYDLAAMVAAIEALYSAVLPEGRRAV
jgi:glycosyltransferase involved in cell wall biosynthesis